jgi:dipeptidyl aminopeptidase/acylaminoacyl peptidase
LAYQTARGDSNPPLLWVSRAGAEIGSVPAEAAVIFPRLSPDGSLVVGRRTTGGSSDIWITDLARGLATQLTFTRNAGEARWSPDGKRLALVRPLVAASAFDVERRTEQPLGEPGGGSASWSPDGRWLLQQMDDIVRLTTSDKSAPPIDIRAPRGRVRQAEFSPDSRYIALISGADEVYVHAMPPDTRQWKVADGGSMPRWRRDGRELFFVSSESTIMAVDVTIGDSFSAGVPRELFRTPRVSPTMGYDVTAEGDRFLIPQVPGQEDVPITVVRNWWVELERTRKPSR